MNSSTQQIEQTQQGKRKQTAIFKPADKAPLWMTMIDPTDLIYKLHAFICRIFDVLFDPIRKYL